ncbi:DoxX family membrane protein [Streptomyces sodiiphilus]|uniref:DoxX family membrane protein n=1 Tax=Streptomyces sodiiphilus TaxID=226217 RepID=A0ABN2PFX6_9ACTN
MPELSHLRAVSPHLTVPGGDGRGGGLRSAASRFALLPLRLFLGVTFLYAGIDKFTDAGPFTGTMSLDAMTTMLESTRDRAAFDGIHALVLANPGPFTHGVAITEIAVGAAVLLGVLTRLAAAVGALLAASFWLTVSWSATPYYFGADLPLLAGFLTLLLAGSGPFAVGRLRSPGRRRGL